MKTLSPLGLVLLAWLPAAPLIQARAADWSGQDADQVISCDDDKYARAVQLVAAEDGSAVHAFWTEDIVWDAEIHYGRSIDEGETWSSSLTDRVISFPDGQAMLDECAAAMNPVTGSLIIVWSEDAISTREIHFGVSHDQGTTWSCETADQILSDPATAVDAGIPSIACDLDGVFHVVWHQLSGETAEVHYSRSADGGATWSGMTGDQVISFPDGTSALDPQITACEDHLFVVWHETGDSGKKTVHVGISSDDGLTWSSATADREICQPPTLIGDLALAAAPYSHEEGIHVVYKASFDTSSPYHYEIYATSSFDLGVTWTGESVNTPVSHDEGGGRSAHNPDVTVRGALGPCAVWDEEEDTAGSKEQHFSFFEVAGWSGASEDYVISLPDGENGYRPSIVGADVIVVPGRGDRATVAAWVAWTEFAGDKDNYEVHLSRYSTGPGAIPQAPSRTVQRISAVPSPARDRLTLELHVAGSGPLAVEIIDANGRCVRHWRLSASPGPLDIPWDGRDRWGRPLSRGCYFARLRSADGQQSVPLVIF
ncbi:MAG: exo-alpha-sialidase [Candidatus Eisenbacteria sp.]|nr:exo-alpha-sialidase [Candidatus Eisenbacteria bacterium]